MRDPDISYETIPGREDTGYSDTNLVTLASPKSKIEEEKKFGLDCRERSDFEKKTPKKLNWPISVVRRLLDELLDELT